MELTDGDPTDGGNVDAPYVSFLLFGGQVR